MTDNNKTTNICRSNELKIRATRHMQFPLTPDQSIAVSILADFITGVTNEEIAVLQGFAGTGKSSLMASLIKSMIEADISFCLLAPTGKAARVLSGYSNQPATTIHHRIFEIAEIINLNPRFRRKHGNETESIFVIDEASMISDLPPGNGDIVFGKGSLLNEMLDYVFGNSGNKVIFIGDPAQLPPVASTFSAALDGDYLFHKYHKMVKVMCLESVVRQAADSGIYKMSLDIRNAINSPEEYPSIEIPSWGDIFCIQADQFRQEYIRSLDQVGLTETIILAHRNQTVEARNNEIRNEVLRCRTPLYSGEPLAVSSNNYHWKVANQLDFLANGDSITLNETGPEQSLGRFRFTTASIIATGFGGNSVELSGQLLLNLLFEPHRAISNQDRAELFKLVLAQYPQIGGQTQHEAVRSDPYFQSLVIRYAYATTVHRAQGSQWRNTFLDLAGWSWFYRKYPKEALRWLYTAITRTKSHLFIMGLPQGVVNLPLAQ
jgi:exodeoxyribonuclease V